MEILNDDIIMSKIKYEEENRIARQCRNVTRRQNPNSPSLQAVVEANNINDFTRNEIKNEKARIQEAIIDYLYIPLSLQMQQLIKRIKSMIY